MRAQVMQRPSNKLLTRTSLALQQHNTEVRSKPPHLQPNPLHRNALPNDRFSTAGRPRHSTSRQGKYDLAGLDGGLHDYSLHRRKVAFR
ncbi:hypothetical protein BH10ACI4_BH10ACI4_27710 [soil metagenome]